MELAWDWVQKKRSKERDFDISHILRIQYKENIKGKENW